MDENRFSFRPLRASDKDALMAISAKIWEGDDYLPHSFDDWVSDPDGVFNGCFLDGRLIGCGRVGFLAPGHAWLEGLRKDPDAGVSGVGRAVALAGLRFLSGVPGLRSIRFSAYGHNPQTIAINEALGFRRVGAWSIKSKRLPGSQDGKEAFGVPAASRFSELASGTDDGGGVSVRRVDPLDAAAVGRVRGALLAGPWAAGFRLESWKAYPLDAVPAIRPDDLIFEAVSPDGSTLGRLVGSLDPLKAQANVAAFSLEPRSRTGAASGGGRAAAALFAAFERAASDAGYSYFETVAPRLPGQLEALDACGYVSWESEDDFLLYEWPAERLGELATLR